MKITKIAQGGIPAGHIRVSITTDESGKVDTRVEGHGPGTSCSGQNDDLLLDDLLDIEIGGFGGTEVVDGGKTSEGYAEEQASKPKPINPLKQKPKKTKPQFGGPWGTQQEAPDMTQGYGV